MVPVLSRQSTSTEAIDSTAPTLWTSAPRPVIRTAPRVKATVAIKNHPLGHHGGDGGGDHLHQFGLRQIMEDSTVRRSGRTGQSP